MRRRVLSVAVLIMAMCSSGCFVKFVAVDKPRPVIPTERLERPVYDIPVIEDLDGDNKIDPTPEQEMWLKALAAETQFSQKCIESIENHNKDAKKHNDMIFNGLNK